MDWMPGIFRFNQYERDRWVAKQASQVAAGARVLDVGAGPGPYRPWFLHCEYRTHDFGQELGTVGKYTQLDYESDIQAIPVPAGSFDVILCTEVLEHVPEPILAVKEIARILKMGGRLFLTAPLGSSLHQDWFGQEASRFSALIDPRRSLRTGWRWPLLVLLWLITLPFCRLLFPLLGSALDKLGLEQTATVGYHVVAERW